MGNNNSIPVSNFQDNITSICVWTLRQPYIIEYYHKNKSYYSWLGNISFDTITEEDIPHIFNKTIESNINLKNKFLNNYNIPNPIPNKYHSINIIVNDYINNILKNEAETQILLSEIQNKLKQ